MRRFVKITLIFIAIIAILLTGAYLYLRFMPEKSLKEQVADFSYSASNLAYEYENNPSVSDKKFINRIIEVTGVISEISTDQNNSIVFILRDKESLSGILCTLSEKNSGKTSRYKIGDTVTIKGTCSGMLFEVVMNKCIIVEG